MPTVPKGTVTIDLREQARRMVGPLFNLLRPWGPGNPIAPTVSPEASKEGPRQFQYPVNVNTQYAPRREYPSLTPFEQLRNLAQLYDIASICITNRIEDLQDSAFSIVPRDKRKKDELESAIKEVEEFWKKPDKLSSFSAWISQVVYEVLSTDALTLYRRPNRGGGLYALEVIDGATIKPLLNERGQTVAYQQILWGTPWGEYKRPGVEDTELNIYTPNELMYLPRFTRPNTPYGYPPTERIILRMNTALRKQAFDLSYFAEGNIPEMIGWPPEGSLTPEQVQQFEVDFNAALAGNDALRRRIKFIPWQMNLKELRPFTYETILDVFMMRVTCAAFAQSPVKLGFAEDVNRSTDKGMQETNQEGTNALAKWLKDNIIDPIIQQDLGHPELECQWGSDRPVDQLTEAKIHQIDLAEGVISPTESRAIRYGDILEGDAPGKPMPPALKPGAEGEPSGNGGGEEVKAKEEADPFREVGKVADWGAYG